MDWDVIEIITFCPFYDVRSPAVDELKVDGRGGDTNSIFKRLGGVRHPPVDV